MKDSSNIFKINVTQLTLNIILASILIFHSVVSAQKDNNIVIPPKSGNNHEYTLIWLHGLGDSAKGFVDLFQSSQSFVGDKTKVLLLTAPLRAVTANKGAVMTSWYDIKSFDKRAKEADRISLSEVNDSYKIIKTHLDEEISILGGDSSKVFLGGFSQGCAMSLWTGIHYDKTLGGLIGLSGYLFQFTNIDNLPQNRYEMPIYLGHGQIDPMVDFYYAKKGYQDLLKKFKNSQLNPEPHLHHSINEDELKKITIWFNDLIKKERQLHFDIKDL